MSFGELFLLLIVIFSVVSIVRNIKKRKALDKLSTHVWEEIEKPAEKEVEALPPETDPTIMIYSFSYAYPMLRCPSCDGENDAGEKTCVICGHDLH